MSLILAVAKLPVRSCSWIGRASCGQGGVQAVKVLALSAVLCGCARPESMSKEKCGGSERAWRAFSSLVQKAPSEGDAFEAGRQFLDTVAEPVLIYELLDKCQAHLQSDGEKYLAAWEACVDRLGELACQGNREALRCLLRVLTEGHYDGELGLTLAYEIVRVGGPALPLLRSLAGERATFAEMLIKDIEEGRTYP